MTSSDSKQVHFQRIGGSLQLSVNSEADLHDILSLDPAHWAMMSIAVNAVRCEAPFLDLMKRDDTGRIRVNAVRELLAWMLGVLRDTSGVMTASDRISIAALNPENPDGKQIAETLRIALKQLGKKEDEMLALSQIDDYQTRVSDSLQNGDGIIPPDPVPDANIADWVRLIMTVCGSKVDRSGALGISAAELEQFEKSSAAYLVWRSQEQKEHDSIYPFGEAKTAELWTLTRPLCSVIDQYFENCRALVFAGEGVAAVYHNTFDPLDKSSVGAFFDKAPLAPASSDCVLHVNGRLNPAFSASVKSFIQAYRAACPGELWQITETEWNDLKSKLASYGAWSQAKPTASLDGVDMAKLNEFQNGKTAAAIRQLIQKDEAVALNIGNCALVHKLLLCQKNMRLFLNNFVSMKSLFSRMEPSLLLAGKLIMDGRAFQLAMVVTDLAAHKAIVEKSNICVMYLNATTGVGAAMKKITIAVAVTSGNMKNLFIGKNGLFYTDDGKIWDAVVIDFLRQPVSVAEVFWQPFVKFGELIHKQADKYLSTRSKEFETKAVSSMEAPPAPKSSAVNGSMLLMGGGLGIAAIGSSFAFMAKSLKDVSPVTIVSVLAGIIIVFGAPFVIAGLIKLFTRSLTLFFEANGCAMNRKMRMSLALGRYFTYVPQLPAGSQLVGIFAPPGTEDDARKRHFIISILVILIALIAACVWYFTRQEKKAETPAPAQQTEAVSVPAASAAPEESESAAPAK